MIHFSLFPTAHWANLQDTALASKPAIVWEKGKDQPKENVQQNSELFSFLPNSLSWQQFHRLIQQTISFFQQQGVQPQHTVAYSGTNRFCGLLTYCSAMAMNARILMLNPAMPMAQQQALLAEYGISHWITDHHFANFSPNLTACELPPFQPQQPATLTLTSGSSGTPKAVVHSMQNHLDNAEGVCELMAFGRNHSWLLSLPLFHVSGQGIVWRWLSQGATLYVYEDKADFYPMLSQVSHASLVPTQLQRYLSQLDKPLQSSPKYLLGGTVIPVQLVDEAHRKGIMTFSGYGMTEMASTICAMENALDSVGKPLKGREVNIVEQEIWVKGAGLALGYWQKNGDIQPLVNPQGWLQTKDRGSWNAKGELVVQGRLDNMFISGGENIQPEEVEKMIYQSSWVEQVFVLPQNDSEFGQRPIAVLQFNEDFAKKYDFQTACNLLKAWLSDKVEKFKQPIAYIPLAIEQYQQQGTIKISRKQVMNDLSRLLYLDKKLG